MDRLTLSTNILDVYVRQLLRGKHLGAVASVSDSMDACKARVCTLSEALDVTHARNFTLIPQYCLVPGYGFT